MKISVMTIIGIENYGSLLQAFATQKKLEEFCDSVEIINCVLNRRFADLMRGMSNPVKILASFITLKLMLRNFNSFSSEHLKLSEKSYTSEDDFEKFELTSDVYCTGSDQIWNPECVTAMPTGPRFLSFISSDKRKFAFASSFGKEQMTKVEVSQSKRYIDQFERISVREDSGVKILEEQYDYSNAIQLVDPTLAMPPEFWRDCAPESKINGEYILMYSIRRNKALETYSKELSKKTKLPLVRLCNRFLHIMLFGKSVLLPPILDFITLIDNAKYVLTDSFHGTAFAMNLNTAPICAYQLRPSRLSSFLRLVEHEHRAIKDFNDFDILNRPVDFDKVNKILARERDRVDEFLSNIFNKEAEPQ